MDRMHFTLTEAKAALAKAQEDMTRYYNQHWEPALEYAPRDKVYLDGSDIQTSWPSKKLAHHFLGPYVVEHRVRPNAYRLWLPHSMSHLHPIFPVVKLMPAPVDPIPGWQSDPPPNPVLVDGEEHYEVEAILNSWVFQRQLQYLVQWKGYNYKHNSWENAVDVHSPLLVVKFYSTHPGAPRQICRAHFDYIAFQSSMDVASGHHSLEGGWCKGTPNPFPFFPTAPSLSVHSGALPEFWSLVQSFRNPRRLSGVSGILRDRLEFLNSTLSPLDKPHLTSRHTTVQSLLTLIRYTCFPASLVRFPQSILFGCSLARSVVYYSLCIILSYIFSLDPPLLAWVISLRTARLPLQRVPDFDLAKTWPLSLVTERSWWKVWTWHLTICGNFWLLWSLISIQNR
jgi:hypothetical protein